MDCLWTNNRRNVREQVGLLQLATSQGFCLIVRISDLQNNICPELANILNDTDILKVGVGVHQKALFITDDHKIAIRGTLELSLLASKAYIPERKLTDLAKALCNINIKKTQELAAVDWNKSNLTSNEKEYAKNRAIATIKVFEKLRDIMIRQQGIEVYNSIEERLSERDLI
jgi:ribonuclease D